MATPKWVLSVIAVFVGTSVVSSIPQTNNSQGARVACCLVDGETGCFLDNIDPAGYASCLTNITGSSDGDGQTGSGGAHVLCCPVNGQRCCFNDNNDPAGYTACINYYATGSNVSGPTGSTRVCCKIDGYRTCYPHGVPGYIRCTTGKNPSPGCCRINEGGYTCYGDETKEYEVCRHQNGEEAHNDFWGWIYSFVKPILDWL